MVLAIFTSFNIIAQNKISGIVINQANDEVITGAIVYFPYMHKGTMTDVKGKFQLNNLQSGTFDLLVSLIGNSCNFFTDIKYLAFSIITFYFF